METSNSGANHAALHAQTDRRGQGPIETINSGHNVAVVNAQKHKWGLGLIETSNSDANQVLHAQNDRWSQAHMETRC